MKPVQLATLLVLLWISIAFAGDQNDAYNNDNFLVEGVVVNHNEDLKITIWEISVKGTAGKTTPVPAGQLDGAPVLGYVFPTTLKPGDVGFGDTQGIVALALTSHPDFDDTPLWDENNDSRYNNDGLVWHPHWVILNEDSRVNGKLSVKQLSLDDPEVVLPPTNPGMPMYMDSPGFQVITDRKSIKVVIPDYRINNQTNFKYDAVTCFMRVNTKRKDLPMLGVYEVYHIASGNLSLPYEVK